MQRYFADQAIVLKRLNYSEADRILTVFTHKHGKISCIAKGVRRTVSKKAPHIELFSLSNFYFARTKGLPLVTQAETINSFSHLKNNLETTKIAFHAAEIVDRLLAEDQPQPDVFASYLKLLTYLDTGNQLTKQKQQLTLTRFQLKILTELGFGQPKNQDKDSVTGFVESIIDRHLISPNTFE